MIDWSFDAIVSAGIADVVVVVPSDRIDEATELFSSRARVVTGGPTRQESVRLGLELVESERVIVHDAARPFAPPTLFREVMGALEDCDAAVPGIQIQDTVKRVRSSRVVETLQREEIWTVQTPQAFWTERLKQAHASALSNGFLATDDAQLIEHRGGRVSVVPGHPDAFKITRPDDLERAEAMAAELDG
jgi:2-C-methyl-D-erythritol 4-phosphate cytidylyltransferase